MTLNPHRAFNAQCEAAFRFYGQCLGGKIVTMLRWSDSPMAEQAPPGWADRILHATLSVGEALLAGSDALPGQYEKPAGFHVLLGIGDTAEAERLFHALSENGTVQMPIQETFWARRFGVVTDRFGISWEINCESSQAT